MALTSLERVPSRLALPSSMVIPFPRISLKISSLRLSHHLRRSFLWSRFSAAAAARAFPVYSNFQF